MILYDFIKYDRLEQHRQRLISLNEIHQFTQIGNTRIEQYYRLLTQIRNQKNTLIYGKFNQ